LFIFSKMLLAAFLNILALEGLLVLLILNISRDLKKNEEEIIKIKNDLEKDVLKKLSNLDFFSDIDKKLVTKLKDQVEELLGKLEIAYSKNAVSEFRAQRAETNKHDLYDIINKKSEDLKDLDKLRQSLENENINLRQALFNMQSEMYKLKNELNLEIEKSKNYYKLLQQSELSQKQGETGNKQEVIKENKIQIQTDFLNRNMIGNDNISMHHPFVQRLIEEYEDMIKIHVSNANKLSFEITDLKKKSIIL